MNLALQIFHTKFNDVSFALFIWDVLASNFFISLFGTGPKWLCVIQRNERWGCIHNLNNGSKFVVFDPDREYFDALPQQLVSFLHIKDYYYITLNYENMRNGGSLLYYTCLLSYLISLIGLTICPMLNNGFQSA